MKVAVIVHTDGGCSPNPGDGGWGAVLRYGEHVKELYGGEPETTNNRMEIMAAIQALEHLKRPSTVQLHTDSTYVRQGVLSWMAKWKRNGWQTSDKKPVKNVDLWQRLEQAAARHDVEWFWVKGHAGVPDNERADELATLGRLKALPNAIRVASWSQKSRGETHEGAGRGVGPASRALGCPDGVGSGQIPAAARRRT